MVPGISHGIIGQPLSNLDAESIFRAARASIGRLRPQDKMAIATIDTKLAAYFANEDDQLRLTLNSLAEAGLCPVSAALEKLNAGLR